MPRLAEHPLRRMLAAGVPVTLSHRRPAVLRYRPRPRVRAAPTASSGLSLAELWQINLNGLRYGLAETGLRRRLMQEFERAGPALGSQAGPGRGTL